MQEKPIIVKLSNNKTHIYFNGRFLCDPEGRLQYPPQIPTNVKTKDDNYKEKFEGKIEWLPFKNQPTVINENALCRKCNKVFNRKVKKLKKR